MSCFKYRYSILNGLSVSPNTSEGITLILFSCDLLLFSYSACLPLPLFARWSLHLPLFPFLQLNRRGWKKKWKTDQSFPQGHRQAEDRHTGRISLGLYLKNTVHTTAHSANHIFIKASHCVYSIKLLSGILDSEWIVQALSGIKTNNRSFSSVYLFIWK